MKSTARLFVAGLLAGVLAAPGHAAQAPDGARIEALTGLKGKLNASEGVFKVSFPRTDIRATVAGVKMNPELGLTAWAAFERAGDQTMMMGDIVLLEPEIGPVMSAALDAGLQVTALHNHFVGESPRVMFMHVAAMGEEQDLARAVGRVFVALKNAIRDKPAPSQADIDPAATSLDPKKIDAVLGATGSMKEGVYKIVIGRRARMAGHEVGKEMGVNTWAAFAGADERAVVDGDFVTREEELQPVLKALRAGRIDVVAIHNHMTGEAPRLVFLHYWGIGPTETLARTLRRALDAQRQD